MRVYQSVITQICVWLVSAMMLAPSVALAHVEQSRVAGFLTGFSHPLSGWDHVLAMVAVGLWGAQLGVPAVWLLPVNFPMMMAVGGLFSLLGMPLPAVELGIAGSALILGLMVATETRPVLGICMAMVGVFAIFHGYAHGTELAPGTSALAYSLGFVVSTGLLHGIGIVIGLVHTWPAGRRVIRSLGVLIVVAGVLFLWRAVQFTYGGRV